MEAHWKHFIYGSDYLPTKDESSSIKRDPLKSSSTSSFTLDNKQFNSRLDTRFGHELEKCNNSSFKSEFNLDENFPNPHSTVKHVSTQHSVNRNQFLLTSSTLEIDSQFHKSLQKDESKEIKPFNFTRKDDFLSKSSEDRMEISHPLSSTFQPFSTHRVPKLHSQQSNDGNAEGHHWATSIKNGGNGKYMSDVVGTQHNGNCEKETTGEEESMSFDSKNCQSSEFESTKGCSSGYEVLRIQHFKVELKELKKEMQRVKQDNDALLKENQSLKEQLKCFHSNGNNISSSNNNNNISIIKPKGNCEFSERGENSNVISREFQAEKKESHSLLDESIRSDVNENNRQSSRRRFSICSSTTENILQEAKCFVRSSRNSNQVVDQQMKRDSSLSSSSTLNSQSEIESAYFNEPAKCDLEVGDVVRFLSKGGTVERGRTMFLGSLPGKEIICAGLELEAEVGKHDGIYKGQRFFQCKKNRGIFVAVSKIVSIHPQSLQKQGMNF